MQRYYLSLPMTGQEMQSRIKAAEIEKKYTDLAHYGKPKPPEGWIPVVMNPWNLSDHMGKGHTYEEYLENDLSIIRHCTAIILCPGWEHSKGCRTELALALKLGLEVIVEK